MRFDRSQYALLKQAVNALSMVCDGAEARDDRGFDGSDTRAGHLYALLPLSAWPLSAFHRVWGWTKKYHRQLELMQVDCASLPEPPLFEGEHRQIALQPNNVGFFVIFPYDNDLIAAFRRIPGQELHTIPIGTSTTLTFRYRTVPAGACAGSALLAFAEEYQFQLGPGVKDLAESSDSLATLIPTLQHEYRIEAEPGEVLAFAIYFPRIPALNDEMKRIPGKRPSYAGGFHWVIPAARQSATALLSFIERHPQFFVSSLVKEQLTTLVGR